MARPQDKPAGRHCDTSAVTDTTAQTAAEATRPGDRPGVPPPVTADGLEEERRTSPLELLWDLVFVGRFVPKKGVTDLLQAVAIVHRDRPVRCCLIGDGPGLGAARALAARIGLDATFTGPLDPAGVINHLKSARILAAPSHTAPNGDAEGFGMVFLEAAACEVPAVAYRHGGVPEAVLDGHTGLLADERDVVGLASNIRHLLDDPALRQRLGAAARERVRQDFDITMRTKALEQLYDEVTARRHERHNGTAASDSTTIS